MQVNLRSDRVARALHAGLQRLSHLGRLQQRRLPKTFFHPRTVDQMQMANAKFSGGAKNAAQHFWPW